MILLLIFVAIIIFVVLNSRNPKCVYCDGKTELDVEKVEMGYGFDYVCTECGERQPKTQSQIDEINNAKANRRNN